MVALKKANGFPTENPTIQGLYNFLFPNDLKEYSVRDFNGEEIIAAANFTISDKKIDEIKMVMREYNKMKEENKNGEANTRRHFMYVAAGYFYDYLRYYYGIKDNWSEFLKTGAQHLHFFNEAWLYHKPEIKGRK